jgi:hypothetical protein
MKNVSYDNIPSLEKWKHDSSVTLAVRASEPGLPRIDELVGELERADKKPSVSGPLLIDLFLTIEYWFKTREMSPKRVNEGRLPAIRGLFECVVAKLGRLLADRDGHPASPAKVSNSIKEMTAACMSNAGYVTDRTKGFTQFSAKQLYAYRLMFKGGRAFQAPWWSENPNGADQPANSKHGYMPILRKATGVSDVAPAIVGWSPFIMTISRIIYMAKHDFDASRNTNNYFHSSYNNGHRVAIAGTIAISDGLITGVRLDSGHYHPGEHNLTAFLMALRMYGVDLSKISLLDFRGDWIGGVLNSAEDFLKDGKSYERFMVGSVAESAKRADTQPEWLARAS